MILIAESGSTKTDWCLAKDYENQERFTTGGLNPYFYDGEGVRDVLKGDLPSHLPHDAIKQIFFYGAGCSTETRKNRVRNGLQTIFKQADIEVNHDLLGSARAVCGNQKGIATILGTGSNACMYDGQTITGQSGGIGFILGDEGSGADLGKRFLRSYFYNELPNDLLQAFDNTYAPDKDEIVDRVYQKPNPNRYLAAYAKFLNEHRDQPFIHNLIESAFSEFINRHLLKFTDIESCYIHSVGSIAYHFKPILVEVMNRFGLQLGRIIVKPIDNLVAYHLESGELKSDA